MTGGIVMVKFKPGDIYNEVQFRSNNRDPRTIVASLAETFVGHNRACVYARYRGTEINIFVQLDSPATQEGHIEVHYLELD